MEKDLRAKLASEWSAEKKSMEQRLANALIRTAHKPPAASVTLDCEADIKVLNLDTCPVIDAGGWLPVNESA